MWYKQCQAFFVMCYQSLGSQPTVTRFLKWLFESQPIAPGYTRPWDISKVLCYLGTICNSEDGSREQGWRSGESARLPPMCPGFDSRTWRHMWVEFVVGSLLCSERFFSGSSGFPLSSKTNISKFQFDLELFRAGKNVY